MNIRLLIGPERDEKKIAVNENISIEGVALSARDRYPRHFPYDILIAKKNGKFAELQETVSEGDAIELLDMRNHFGDLTYRRSLMAVYLLALRDVFENKGFYGISACAETSINYGIFTKLKAVKNAPEDAAAKAAKGITEEEIQAVSDRMREIVDRNIPFRHETMPRDDAIDYWRKKGFREKAELLEETCRAGSTVMFYVLDDFRMNYCGRMLPSTGYLKYFELRKYRDGILLRHPKYQIPEEIPKYVDDFKMYEAYQDEHSWLKLLGTHYVSDMNRVIDSGGARELVLLSEALHEKKIADIADEIRNKSRRIILIAGPSSSGKTTFARRLCIQLRVNGLRPLYMGTDDYFINREDIPEDENGEKDYESLNAVDVELFCSNMNDLLDGREVDIPEFDFIEGRKIFGRRITRIDRNQPIVIEGIHALNSRLTEAIDNSEKFKIYISPLTQMGIDSHNSLHPTDARMLRRMVRDYKYRGKSAAVTIREWPKVRAAENVNIFPYNSEADVLFNSNLPYESGLLARHALPLLEEIGPEEPEYSEAQSLMFFLQFFSSIEDDSIVPNNSIVREFIGGSVFVE